MSDNRSGRKRSERPRRRVDHVAFSSSLAMLLSPRRGRERGARGRRDEKKVAVAVKIFTSGICKSLQKASNFSHGH